MRSSDLHGKALNPPIILLLTALISLEGISKVINNLNTSTVTQQGNISTKTVKDNKDLFLYFMSANFNSAVNKGELKQVDIAPIYKKNQEMKKNVVDL